MVVKALTMVKNPEKGGVNNSGSIDIVRKMKIEDILLMDEFKDLFSIKNENLSEITLSMKKNGFDSYQPLHVWKVGLKFFLIDGHTRRLAALAAQQSIVPVYIHSFSDKKEALEYASSLQLSRRNLSDTEIFTFLGRIDNLKTTGRKDKSKATEITTGKSASVTAKKLGTSTTKVERARSVAKKASATVKQDLNEGKISINEAYNTIKKDKNNDELKLEEQKFEFSWSDSYDVNLFIDELPMLADTGTETLQQIIKYLIYRINRE